MKIARPVERFNNEIKINITRKQKDFIDSKCDEALYGGSVGGGKTYALLLFSAMRRMSIPGSRGIIFRRTYPEIERSLMPDSRKIFSYFGAKYNEVKHHWKFPNGSIQTFGHCESEMDSYNYQSDQYQDICFDEATHFSSFQFNYLCSRLRNANFPGVKTMVRLATNPGGPGHFWIYERFIKPSQHQQMWSDPETKKTFTFIPSRLIDNPYLLANDPMYAERLKDLKKISEKKYMALVEGRWDIFEGAYFTEWKENLHVLKKNRIPDSHTLKFLSLDWGFAEPACVLWFEVTPLGRIFIYRELQITRKSPKELARLILEMSPEREEYMYMRASPEIWGKKVETENGGEVIKELMQAELGDRILMEKANNARVAGWLKMREYLSLAPDGYPWLQISPCCTNLIRTIPAMIHEDRPGRNSEDIQPDSDDHACVVGDTVVTTRDGSKVIADLCGTEGEIWTDVGWKKYTGVQLTRKNVPVFKVTTSNGDEIIGTEDHRIMTPDGWRMIKELDKGFSLLIQSATCKQKLFLQQSRNSMVRAIINAVHIFKKTVSGSIALSGNFIMGLSLRNFMSITRITTDQITKKITSNLYPSLNTCLIMPQPLNMWQDQESLSIKSGPWHLLGMDRKREKSGTVKMQRNRGEEEDSFARNVNFVALNIKQGMRGFLGFATSIVKCLGIDAIIQKYRLTLKATKIKSVRLVGKQDVYNLCVEDIHRYFANGIFLIANCDSARYGLTSLREVPKSPLSPYATDYEKVFGIKEPGNGHRQQIAGIPGRSGYG